MAVDPVLVTNPVGVFVTGARALFGLAKNKKRVPSEFELAKRGPAWNDPGALRALERKLTGPGKGARTPGAQIAIDKGREFQRKQVEQRLAELEPEPPPPPPPPPAEEPLPGDEEDFYEDDELQEEYEDDQEAYDDYLSDLEAESGIWDQPWFEQTDPSGDPTEQIGDPERRKVERELRDQDVAPYAVEYYRSQFVDDRRPRVPDRVPTRVPGRVGSSGAMVEGIVGLIRLGRALWELQTETQPIGKGPPTRPKVRVRKIPQPKPELEPEYQKEIGSLQKQVGLQTIPRKAREAALGRGGAFEERPVRIDQTTRRALETRTRTAAEPELELEEIKVTKQRRAPPATRGPRTGTRTPTRTLVDLRTLGLLYDLVKPKPKTRTVIRERVITQPGTPELPPTVPEITTPTRPPELPPARERDRVEQTLTQQQQIGTRTREKKCVKEKENRTVCYKGFYRERKGSTSKRRWNRIDCITGKEL